MPRNGVAIGNGVGLEAVLKLGCSRAGNKTRVRSWGVKYTTVRSTRKNYRTMFSGTCAPPSMPKLVLERPTE